MNKTCQNCKARFDIAPEDLRFYERIHVPPPTWCPECRMVRRMAFRNERALYKRKCDAPGHNEEMISIYSPEKNLKAYDYKFWWSDAWDPLSFGKEYDFSKPFFNQFQELRNIFPFPTVSNSRAENSEYCNVNDKSKDCYLISASYENEKVLYSNRVAFSKDTLDVYIAFKDELCYEDVACKDSYRLFYSRDSLGCLYSAFLYDCHNCQNCFGSINLRGKHFYIFNKPYTKEEYFEKIKEFDLGSYQKVQEIKQSFRKILDNSIHRFATLVKTTNVVGDNVSQSKNCYFAFDIEGEVEDSKFLNWGGYNMKDSYDVMGSGDGSELMYDTFDAVKNSKILFSGVVYDSHDVKYSFNCHGSNNLFGCIGFRSKSYCILNKQYTKEEYEKLVPKIIDHMNQMPYVDKKGRVYKYGEFFPSELSPFCYNETIAQEYFSLTKEQALEHGYSWKDPESRNYTITMTTERIPDHIKDVPDSITKEIIQCAHFVSPTSHISPPTSQCNEQCTTAFKIIPQELAFYHKMNLPIPRLCPNCRHYQRIKQRNPLKLWHRKCMCAGATSGQQSATGFQYQNTATHRHGQSYCTEEFETSYAPERPEIVYCEQCYNSEAH